MDAMKRNVFLLFLLAVSVNAGFGGAVIKEFTGEPGFNQAKLKWVVSAESDLKGYRVLRSFDGSHFQEIAFVEAKSEESGEKTYIYIDRTVFKTSGRTCYYKLRLASSSDGTTTDLDQVVAVSPKISAARHTWGSIKAMFR